MLKGIFTHPFTKFVAKKAVFYAVVIFLALTLAFLIPRYMPGSPIQSWLAGMGKGKTTGSTGMNYQEAKRIIEAQFGFDKPLFEQYLNFWRQLLRGDLGLSFRFHQPVSEKILAALPYTLALAIPVLVISFFFGNWIGAKAAYMGGKASELIYFTSVFSNRLPSFWLGMILVYVFVVQLGVLPWGGPGGVPLITPGVPLNIDSLVRFSRHYTLPFISLFIVYLGGWSTGMRSMVIHEMDAGYVRYSDQLGFRKSKCMAYAKRNAMLPQFTGLNLYLNAIIGETVVIENVFGWPGVGRLLYDAASSRDYPLIIGVFLVMLVVVVLGNFIIDILYGLVDPRIRIGTR
jgi:peptide/nickel transport system permease protein